MCSATSFANLLAVATLSRLRAATGSDVRTDLPASLSADVSASRQLGLSADRSHGESLCSRLQPLRSAEHAGISDRNNH